MDILDMDITLARGLRMLSPRLMLILISAMVDMVDMVLGMDILDMDITLARGLLMLCPRLMLILISSMVDIVATMVILMLDMDMVDTSGDKSQDSKICPFQNDNHTCIGKLFGQCQWK